MLIGYLATEKTLLVVFERDLYSLCAQAGKCPLPATILCTITKEEFIFLVSVYWLIF